jgi:glutamate--cysteine ligase
VGAELEWIVAAATHPAAVVPLADIRDALRTAGPLPGGGVVTFEPGGQLELSSRPAEGLSACWRALETDVARLRQALHDAGLILLPTAIDPYRKPHRQVQSPRYDSMEVYFDRRGGVGRVMMCSTAAVQVNLDAGADVADVRRRWAILHAVGPALAAAFANSPIFAGRVTRWKSTRQAVWQRLDPGRTAPPRGADPFAAWSRYALDAPVMLVRQGANRWCPDPGFTFAGWMARAGRNGGRPTRDDLVYHLTTLFPPVRPRGWLEVRYIDAQPPEFWPVPIAVLTVLAGHPEAGSIAMASTDPVAGAWVAAARHGLEHAGLALAAAACFEAAVRALPEFGVEPALVDLVESFRDRYVARGRCPADDALQKGPPR